MLSNCSIKNWLIKELTKLNREMRRKNNCLKYLRNETEKYQIAFAQNFFLRNSLTYFGGIEKALTFNDDNTEKKCLLLRLYFAQILKS